MTELLLKNHAPDARGLVHRVTPQSAGWGYVGFELFRLRPGQTLAAETGRDEACLVIVGGKATIEAGDQRFPEIGARTSPFEGKKPFAVYVPYQSNYRVEAASELELAVCRAPGGGSHPVAPDRPRSGRLQRARQGHQHAPRLRHPARERAARTRSSWSR